MHTVYMRKYNKAECNRDMRNDICSRMKLSESLYSTLSLNYTAALFAHLHQNYPMCIQYLHVGISTTKAVVNGVQWHCIKITKIQMAYFIRTYLNTILN